MKCPKCNNEVNSNAKFCDNCGMALQQQATTPTAKPIAPPTAQPIAQTPTTPSAKNSQPAKKEPWYMNPKIVFGGLIGIIVLVSIIGFAVSSNSDSSSSSNNSSSFSDDNDNDDYNWFDDEDDEEEEQVTEKPTKKAKKKKLSKKEYKKKCKTITYKKLARNPKKYKGKKYKITGKVIQVTEDDEWFSEATALRIDMTAEKNEFADGGYIWDDTIYAVVDIPEGDDKILEDDIITFWGECTGEKTYTSVLGSDVTLPSFEIKYYEVNNK